MKFCFAHPSVDRLPLGKAQRLEVTWRTVGTLRGVRLPVYSSCRNTTPLAKGLSELIADSKVPTTGGHFAYLIFPTPKNPTPQHNQAENLTVARQMSIYNGKI